MSINNNRLADIIDRIEAMESDKAEIANNIKEVYIEAKSAGFDPKIIRKVVALRKVEADKRAEEKAMIDLYMNALGALADTPLGRAALEREFE